MERRLSSVPVGPSPAPSGKHQTNLAGLAGYVSALPTPFQNGAVDERSLARLCEWQIRSGISGLVVCGTTGEAPTLNMAEQRRVIEVAAETAARRVPVIAGVGSNSTMRAVELASQAAEAGADALLAVVPYYNRPQQEGLYRHFAVLHDATELPLILYDVPTRTGTALADSTVVRLAGLPRIVGLKDATGDLARPVRLRRVLGHRLHLFTGEDASALAYFAQDGDGCISVTSNVAPRLCQRLYDAAKNGELREAQRISVALARLTAALFAETNPVPVKYALELLGMMSAEPRLPLVEGEEPMRRELAAALDLLGLSVVKVVA
jgi:4-hydroxy-tetrahydrodipicolinate synthase